jgi:hypothetical protein
VNISFQLKITEQRQRAEGRGHKERKIFNLPSAIGLLAPNFSYEQRFFSLALRAREKGVLVRPPDFSYALAMK